MDFMLNQPEQKNYHFWLSTPHFYEEVRGGLVAKWKYERWTSYFWGASLSVTQQLPIRDPRVGIHFSGMERWTRDESHLCKSSLPVEQKWVLIDLLVFGGLSSDLLYCYTCPCTHSPKNLQTYRSTNHILPWHLETANRPTQPCVPLESERWVTEFGINDAQVKWYERRWSLRRAWGNFGKNPKASSSPQDRKLT